MAFLHFLWQLVYSFPPFLLASSTTLYFTIFLPKINILCSTTQFWRLYNYIQYVYIFSSRANIYCRSSKLQKSTSFHHRKCQFRRSNIFLIKVRLKNILVFSITILKGIFLFIIYLLLSSFHLYKSSLCYLLIFIIFSFHFLITETITVQ